MDRKRGQTRQDDRASVIPRNVAMLPKRSRLNIGLWNKFYPHIWGFENTKPLHIRAARWLFRVHISLAKAVPPYMGDRRCETPICGFDTKKLSKVQLYKNSIVITGEKPDLRCRNHLDVTRFSLRKLINVDDLITRRKQSAGGDHLFRGSHSLRLGFGSSIGSCILGHSRPPVTLEVPTFRATHLAATSPVIEPTFY